MAITLVHVTRFPHHRIVMEKYILINRRGGKKIEVVASITSLCELNLGDCIGVEIGNTFFEVNSIERGLARLRKHFGVILDEEEAEEMTFAQAKAAGLTI